MYSLRKGIEDLSNVMGEQFESIKAKQDDNLENTNEKFIRNLDELYKKIDSLEKVNNQLFQEINIFKS